MLQRDQLTIEAYTVALDAIPLTIAENGGLDPIDIMVELRSKHATPENKWFGVQIRRKELQNPMIKGNYDRELQVLIGDRNCRNHKRSRLKEGRPRTPMAESAQIRTNYLCASTEVHNNKHTTNYRYYRKNRLNSRYILPFSAQL